MNDNEIDLGVSPSKDSLTSPATPQQSSPGKTYPSVSFRDDLVEKLGECCSLKLGQIIEGTFRMKITALSAEKYDKGVRCDLLSIAPCESEDQGEDDSEDTGGEDAEETAEEQEAMPMRRRPDRIGLASRIGRNPPKGSK
jgi:hypothetical protein